MEIKVVKLIGKEYLDKACSRTVNKECHPNLFKMYKSEHSPIRVITFWIDLIDIPTFASTHFVRHTVGIIPFVKSNREDRSSYIGDLGRNTPVSHSMMLNAQSLINMARRRLCGKAHPIVREIMHKIKDEVFKIDPDLAACMLPDCLYRCKCWEPVTCGGYSK